MFVIKHRKILYIISSVLLAGALGAVAFIGLNFGIDFTGGSLLEARYEQSVESQSGTARPEVAEIQNALKDHFSSALIQPTGADSVLVRLREITPQEHAVLLEALTINDTWTVTEERFNLIGPVIGQELRAKAWVALAVVVFAIILFIAYVFRHVSKPVSSFKYGLIAVVALLHDIIIPTGVFAILGAYGFEVDILFVMALLAILGFSVNDTIVVFDRIRENLRRNQELNVHEPFEETVGVSLTQTYARSLNTSLTTLAVLVALAVLGGDSTRHFAVVLAIGVVAGTYSSIFLASPLLVTLEKSQKPPKEPKKKD